jgi:hypothetical protein
MNPSIIDRLDRHFMARSPSAMDTHLKLIRGNYRNQPALARNMTCWWL